jgi:hypothetical protein
MGTCCTSCWVKPSMDGGDAPAGLQLNEAYKNAMRILTQNRKAQREEDSGWWLVRDIKLTIPRLTVLRSVVR